MTDTRRPARSTRNLFTSGEVGAVVGGACKGNLEAFIQSVVVDSRKVEPGSLFVALDGERVDGHAFIADALTRGATCVIADAAKSAIALRAYNDNPSGEAFKNTALVLVDSPLRALQSLAREHRRRISGLVRIGITGSSGKTTTKECVGAALKYAYPEGALIMNEGNLNSDIGLALSMFALDYGHRVGVFEMGMNRVGEMDELAEIFEPDLAVITNIGTAHIGLIGSRQGIASEKKRIFSRFAGAQKGFVWESDDFKEFLKADVDGTIFEFGPHATKGLGEIASLGLRGWSLGWMGQRFVFPLPGFHNLLNALAALSVCAELRVSPELVAHGLSEVKPLFGRSEIFEGRVSLVRDCYNANPDSVRAAVEMCESVEWPGRKVYILGSMLELGESSVREHRLMGELAASSSAKGLFFFGTEAEEAYRAARESVSAELAATGRHIFHTSDISALKTAVLNFLEDGDMVLAKASRGLELERLTEEFFNAGLVAASVVPGGANSAGGTDKSQGGVHAS